jgi:hemolysin activation/secretion protein
MDCAKKNMMKMMCFAVGILLVSAMVCIAETTEQSLMPLSQEAEQIKEQKEAAEKAKREEAEKAKVKVEKTIEKVNLPEDNTSRLSVKEIVISGNKLITTDKLLKNTPEIYNASDKSLAKAESDKLYDLRPLKDIIAKPGEPRQVSTRTIQGFTQYILSVYQHHHYAGIYVYVPADAVQSGKELKDGILPIQVLEASVAKVTVKSYDADQNEVPKGYLRKSAVESWSPVKPDKVVNQKELDDYINLLNQNPDRYVSAVVTKGKEPNSLAVEYDIYEASPWHWFVQIDNSGSKERQWSPKLGLINTNLLGIDDTFQVLYQAPWDKGITENYSIYGSYDFPLWGPKLRLNVYAGYSQFNISPTGPTGFLGSGDFYGGILRYNALQVNDWFFDITGGLSHERSRTKPSEFPFSVLESDVQWGMWSTGFEIHRRNDMMDTSFSFDRSESMSGSSKEDFAMARTGANPDFTIYTGAFSHSQYLDPNKINRLSGSLRIVRASDRLVPAKMTAIGGMYTVRGYKEVEVIGDEAVLASGQYEFDIVKYNEAKEGLSRAERAKAKRPFLRKLAPLAFIDYGHAQIKHPISGNGEDRAADLLSIGVGIVTELGDHFSGGVYYGSPLLSTEETRSGVGRVNVGVMVRW